MDISFLSMKPSGFNSLITCQTIRHGMYRYLHESGCLDLLKYYLVLWSGCLS